jgi:hypothetical protein
MLVLREIFVNTKVRACKKSAGNMGNRKLAAKKNKAREIRTLFGGV